MPILSHADFADLAEIVSFGNIKKSVLSALSAHYLRAYFFSACLYFLTLISQISQILFPSETLRNLCYLRHLRAYIISR